ncbi:hypothetical protein [Dyella silvatica]|uniref:hypothetical protein n=1 Tax=Dyella silvatica TaxID=2992128 RepID=UPI0022566047|nr:hypothetical protein [Dyella silvatica]
MKLNPRPPHRPVSKPDSATETPTLSPVKPPPTEHVDYDRRRLAVEHFDHYIDALPDENERFRVH